MLHENAKQRFWRMVPLEYDLEWEHPRTHERITGSLDLDPSKEVRWGDPDAPIVYPSVTLSFTEEGVSRGDLGYDFKEGVYKEPHPDPGIAYRKITAEPQRSMFQITVGVENGHQGFPKKVIADEIAHDVWHEFRFNADHLHEQGTYADGEPIPYAWPMNVEWSGDGIRDTSGMIDELAIQRRQMLFRVEYAYYDSELVPAVQAIEYEYGVHTHGQDLDDVEYHGPGRITFGDDGG